MSLEEMKDFAFGKIPVEWDVKSLGECVEFWDGKRVPLKQEDRDAMKGDFPYYGASGIIDHIDSYLFDDDLILVGEDGENVISRHLPLAFQVSGKIWVNNHAHVLKPKENYNIGFLTQRLEFHDYSLLVSGSAQPKLNQRNLKGLQLVVPPEPEQAKIAEILSTVDRAIEQTEAAIAKQQRIKTGLMQDLLTRGIDEHGNLRSEQTHQFKDSPLGRIPVEWEVSPIEAMLERIIDYRGRTPTKVEAGVPLLTAKNVRDGYLDEEPREFIAKDAYEKWMTRGVPIPGDVLFTTEAPMGNVTRVPNYQIALAQRLLTLCPRPEVLLQDYLFWLLHWHRTTERLELLTSGSTVTGVKQSVFRKVIFRFPNRTEQERLSNVLQSHDNSIINQKTRLHKLHALKTGLMQDLLIGKKRVTALLDCNEDAKE